MQFAVGPYLDVLLHKGVGEIGNANYAAVADDIFRFRRLISICISNI